MCSHTQTSASIIHVMMAAKRPPHDLVKCTNVANCAWLLLRYEPADVGTHQAQ